MHAEVTINFAGHPQNVARGLTSAQALIAAAGLPPGQHLLFERHDDVDVPLAPSDYIILTGDERFSVSAHPYPADDNPCLRKPIRPHFNGDRVPEDKAFARAKVTFDELKALDPAFQAGDGVFIELADLPDEAVQPGWRLLVQKDDRFYTAPCGNVGYGTMFEKHLADARALFTSLIVTGEQNRHIVVVPNVTLAQHWDRDRTDVLVLVPQGYPTAALDMFWVEPHLRLADGRQPEGGDSREEFMGRVWQRFSWHYTRVWDPMRDSIATHLRFALSRLAMNK